MDADDFRRIALSLPGAEEGSHMGAVDFRVGGRIFATLAAVKKGYGNLMLTPEVQADFVAEQPDVFVPIAGGWGKNGATHVVLSAVHEDVLEGALRAAWKIRKDKKPPTRRKALQIAGLALAGAAMGRAGGPVSLFDGKTLDGWIQIENSATSFSSGSILDPAAFTGKLNNGTDAVSSYLRGRLGAVYSAQDATAKAVISALVKELNQIVAGPSIYDKARFQGVALRPETQELIRTGKSTTRLNKLLIEDAYPAELAKSVTTGWVVKDGAMASTGVGRGVIHTAKDYGRFRLSFTMRHVSGNPDHQACVLIFCTRPKDGERPLDALGGIQFQVPNGGHWDYRPGMNNAGGAEFTTVMKGRFDPHEWSRVEIQADASNGTARMTVAQPPGSEPIEVLKFEDPAAGKAGPIAWQMHNAGLFDEYKDVSIEVE